MLTMLSVIKFLVDKKGTKVEGPFGGRKRLLTGFREDEIG